MEKLPLDWEQKTLINELTQGKELAKQLMNHLNPSSSSPETRQCLVEEILSSYEKALSMLNLSAETKLSFGLLEKTPDFLANVSPRSDVTDLDFKGQIESSKKRKTQPRWTQQVTIGCGSDPEGSLGDGYSWRKYGQKKILGANFPRNYYRCTHRHSQGCLATKQVQKSNQDTSVFEVTYRGRHTCRQSSHLAMSTASPPSLKNGLILSSQNKEQHQKQKQQQIEVKPQASKEVLSTFEEQLQVKTDLDVLDTKKDIFPPFSFPHVSTEIDDKEKYIFFTESMMKNTFLDSLSPTFLSPWLSESNYVMMPQSVTNLPVGELEVSLHNVDLDSNFAFDESELLV